MVADAVSAVASFLKRSTRRIGLSTGQARSVAANMQDHVRISSEPVGIAIGLHINNAEPKYTVRRRALLWHARATTLSGGRYPGPRSPAGPAWRGRAGTRSRPPPDRAAPRGPAAPAAAPIAHADAARRTPRMPVAPRSA